MLVYTTLCCQVSKVKTEKVTQYTNNVMKNWHAERQVQILFPRNSFTVLDTLREVMPSGERKIRKIKTV